MTPDTEDAPATPDVNERHARRWQEIAPDIGARR
jgi:hypothetical protein